MKDIYRTAPIGGKNLCLLQSFGRKAGIGFAKMTGTFAAN